jgi:hypothetical protein
MFLQSHLHAPNRTAFLRFAAVAVALLVMVSSWFPSGLMVCIHDDGAVQMVSSVFHHQTQDETEQHACCSHHDCVDVVIELPEVIRSVQVVAPLAATVPVIIHWLPFQNVHSELAAKSLAPIVTQRQRPCALGPPHACSLRLFRTLCLQV